MWVSPMGSASFAPNATELEGTTPRERVAASFVTSDAAFGHRRPHIPLKGFPSLPGRLGGA